MLFQLISSEIGLVYFFINIGEKASSNIHLMKTTCLYGAIYLDLDDYPPRFDKISVIFEKQINRNLRCSHGYNNCVRHTDFITWGYKNSWDMFLSEF